MAAGDPVKIDIRIPTLGKHNLQVMSFQAKEKLSEPFELDVVMFDADNAEIKAHEMIGKNIGFDVKYGNQLKRSFSGVIVQYYVANSSHNVNEHYVKVMPKMVILKKSRNYRVFEKMKAGDIIKRVCSDIKVQVKKVPTSKLQREFCMQYDETDFDFVSRLIEEEGWNYYFDHDGLNHDFNIVEASATRADSILATIKTHEVAFDAKNIHNYTANESSVTLYEYLAPSRYETASKPTKHKDFSDSGVKLNRFLNVDHIDKHSAADRASNYIEGEEALVNSVDITCNDELATLGKTSLSIEEKGFVNGDYHINELLTHINDGVITSHLVCFPSDLKFHKQSFFQPRIYGIQTAVVIDENDPEKLGRVKVKFHWGDRNTNTSAWVRVGQTWAGNGWGSYFIPRVDSEVILQFVNGDPDKPIITGQVYNATNKPPETWGQEANGRNTDKTFRNGFKSRSYGSKTASEFNEISFGDEKGKEEVYIHAQKDLNVWVEKNRNTTLEEGDDTYELRKGNVKNTLKKGNKTTELTEGNETITLKKGNRYKVLTEGNETIQLKNGNRVTELMNGNDTLTLKDGKRTVEIKGNEKLTINDGNRKTTLEKGNDTLTLSKGNLTIKMSAGACTIEAAQKIELKVAGSTVKIEPSGISLSSNGAEVKLDPSGVQVKGMMVKVEGQTMAEVKGSAMVKIQGGVTMIN